MNNNKVILFSAPSGSGKSTVVNHLLDKYNNLEFSVSATSRAPRGEEKEAEEYYFYSIEEFKSLIKEESFVEYEQVYPGSFYGTLKSELERIWAKGNIILFDIDVMGGISLKKLFGDSALAIFVKAPSIECLRDRLISRGTDSPEAIDKRVAKAEEELKYESSFDYTLVNNILEKALEEAEAVIEEFIKK